MRVGNGSDSSSNSSNDFTNGAIAGVVGTIAGAGACYIVHRCVNWYRDPTSRPFWLRRNQPQTQQEQVPMQTISDDMGSLTRQLANSLESWKWMRAYQYFTEMHPQLPDLYLNLHQRSSQQSLPQIRSFHSTSTVNIEDLPLQTYTSQGVYSEENEKYAEAMIEVAQKYPVDIDQNYYKWLVGSTNMMAERRHPRIRTTDAESVEAENLTPQPGPSTPEMSSQIIPRSSSQSMSS